MFSEAVKRVSLRNAITPARPGRKKPQVVPHSALWKGGKGRLDPWGWGRKEGLRKSLAAREGATGPGRLDTTTEGKEAEKSREVGKAGETSSKVALQLLEQGGGPQNHEICCEPPG